MKYISILRGINVGGHKKVKMADLKSLYETQGFESVTTYIQSGNVIFESTKNLNKTSARDSIEKAIEEKYGFHVPVDIRTNKELEQVVENCPFEEALSEENSAKVLVTFLQSTPSKQNQNLLLKLVKPPEKLTIQGEEVYLYCPNGYGKSKLTNTFIENKLDSSATTRNWKSVKKLYELSLD